MSLQHTRLTEVVYVPSSVGSVYTHPGSSKSHVKGFVLHNTNSSTEVVEIHWVPDSAGSVGSAAASTRIFKVQILENETQIFDLPYGIVMVDTNETIQMVTTTASKVTCLVLGDKDT